MGLSETDESNNRINDDSFGYDNVNVSVTTSETSNDDYESTPITINGIYEPVDGNFNGDNITDVLWYVPGTTQDYIWFFESDGSFTSSAFSCNG